MRKTTRLIPPMTASLFLAIGLLLAFSFSAQANARSVSNANDSGAGSLRQALHQAGVSDTITFDPTAFPPGNPATIALLSPLPEIITAGLTIDASGAGVILDGRYAGNSDGLRIKADGVTVRHLQIVNFDQDGIDVDPGSENTRIESNVIGGNEHHGIRVQGSGISGTRILNNFLGTDASGTLGNGNTFSGISIKEGPRDTLIQGNRVAANDDHGITIWGPVTDTRIVSNSVGTDAGGSLDLGNKLHGIIIRVGALGTVVGPGNRIAYNGWDGVRVEGASTLGNTITRNSITANDDMGIHNVDGGNAEIAPPTLLTVGATSIQGQAQPEATVELFTDPFFEGRRFITSTTADAEGRFTATLTIPLTEPLVTATATDIAGNTSEFAAACGPQGLGTSNIWPYCTTTPSPISSPFGPRQMASQGFRYDFHRGVDLPAPLGTPFYAINEGIVTQVVTDPVDLDGTIRIRHSGLVTYYSHYRHVAQPFVTVDQKVTKGMLIGSTGQSASRFEHLHFEIRDAPGGYEKYAVNAFGHMPFNATDDYELQITQVSLDPADPANPTTVLLTVTGPRQELDLNRFIVSSGYSQRTLDFNALNRSRTPAPNVTVPDVLDNPYQDDICIMPARFNTSSDVYRLNLAFHRMPGAPPYVVSAQAVDLFSHTVTAKALLPVAQLLLSPAVVTASTPTGRWVTHVHTLTNASLATQTYTLTAMSAQSWTVTIEPRTVSLAPGESITFTSHISVPSRSHMVTGTTDCVVLAVLPHRVYSPVKAFYLPLVAKGYPL